MQTAEIVSARELRARGLAAPPRYSLRFPSHWRASPLQNPHAAALERSTLEWLREYGMGVSAAERERLRKFEIGAYGGYSLPRAPFEPALIVTQFISLWLLWDDLQVEDEVDWSSEQVLAALDGDAPSSPSRYVTAWADLGQRLRARQSPGWLRRLTGAMRQWLENAKRETQWARAFREGTSRGSSDELLACRTISIGMYPTFYLIELCEGMELDDTFHEHPSVLELKRLASRLVGMGNDLGGVAKDIAQRWLNLVLVTADERRLSLTEAFGAVVDLHNRDVSAFDRLAAALPGFGSDHESLVSSWIQAVRYNVYGFALWESRAERYQETKALVGSTPLIAEVDLESSAISGDG